MENPQRPESTTERLTFTPVQNILIMLRDIERNDPGREGQIRHYVLKRYYIQNTTPALRKCLQMDRRISLLDKVKISVHPLNEKGEREVRAQTKKGTAAFIVNANLHAGNVDRKGSHEPVRLIEGESNNPSLDLYTLLQDLSLQLFVGG